MVLLSGVSPYPNSSRNIRASYMSINAKQIWEAALGRLQMEISQPSFETWLRDTVGISVDETIFTIGVPTPFVAEWLERRMYPFLQKTVREIAATDLDLQFKVVQKELPSRGKVQQKPALGKTERGFVPIPKRLGIDLSKKHTFENFVVGESNQLAFAAASMIALRPGESYNPLFLHGGAGLGKTHLLQAIVLAARENSTSCLYTTAEQFTNDFIGAIRSRNNERFNSKYRTVDILLVDDVHFFNGKKSTIEAFFHTCNDLHDSGRQIILSSSYDPSDPSLLDDRLRSRFAGGLIAAINPPDHDTRLSILSSKASSLQVSIEPEVVEAIAAQGWGNVRDLEGAINQIAAWTQFTGASISLEKALGLIPSLSLGPTIPTPSAKEVISKTASRFGVSPSDLTSGTRGRRASLARQVAMSVLSLGTPMTNKDIASLFSQKSSSSISKARNKVSSMEKSDPSFEKTVSSIRGALFR